MEPLYSVLLCNQVYEEYRAKIDEWLNNGIKVIWFTNSNDEAKEFETSFKAYKGAYLLQIYSVSFSEQACIIDGEDRDGVIKSVIEPACPSFNAAQYFVEHCKSDEHIVVQASAGTGKTTVMIDRIMFLMHTIPDLTMSDIYMITFTNDATNQMNKRLQEVLTTRYELTGKQRYLRWLEDQSQMSISTIHSFAYTMLSELGIGESFTKNMSIRSFKYEKKELVKDTLDANIDDRKAIKDQLGVPFYRANSLIEQYWDKFLQLGISHADMDQMDWGKPMDDASKSFHSIVKELIPRLDNEYYNIKRENDGVGVDDIMRDLQEVISSGNVPHTDIRMRYLFIDEFQDSDLSQIMVACSMVKMFGAALFVVGDAKQSIYRFRGANERAFDMLYNQLSKMGVKKPSSYELINNYRTSSDVLEKMDRYFSVWGKEGYFKYDNSAVSLKEYDGMCKMIHVDDKSDEFDKTIVSLTNERLEDLKSRVEEGGIKANDQARVVLLCRTRNEVNRCARVLRKNKIPASINEDGSFYACEAVRDFYTMVSSFMFSDEPKYIFNYLLTPYAGDIDPMNVNEMEMLHGDYENMVGYLDHFLNQTDWKKYHKDMRLKPVLSVLKEILDNTSVVDNFITNRKKVLMDLGWLEDRCNAQTRSDAVRYQADLEKLMDVLQRNFGGEKVSIYDIYNFLQLNIATNRSEPEANVQTNDDYRTVLCMTVHKAKGLEFDTVIMPYTNRRFITFDSTELIVDPISKKVGWRYTGDREKKNREYKYAEMQNNYYDDMKSRESFAVVQEEMRILYVAMTRTIRNFICLVPNPKNDNTWASHIMEVGVDYE